MSGMAAGPTAEFGQRAPSEVETGLRQLWTFVLGTPVEPDDDFFDLGGTSLDALRLLALVERDYGVAIPPDRIAEASSVVRMAAILAAGGVERAGRLLVVRESGSRPPLLLVPGIGGNALGFRPLIERLPDQPAYAFASLVPSLTDSFVDLAGRYASALVSSGISAPYALIGQSYGGMLALEIARQLQAAGHAVSLLALLDTYGPGYPRYRSLPWRLGAHGRNLLAGSGRDGWRYVRARGRSLLERAVAATRLAGLRGGFVGAADARTRRLDTRLRYEPTPYPGRVTLVRAQAQPVASVPDPHLGWSDLMDRIEVIDAPGGHASLLASEHVAIWAARFDQVLRQAQETTALKGTAETVGR